MTGARVLVEAAKFAVGCSLGFVLFGDYPRATTALSIAGCMFLIANRSERKNS